MLARSERELQPELECTCSARPKDVRGALGRPVSNEVARARDVIFRRNDRCCNVGQVCDVEQVEDFSDEVELHRFGNAESLGHSHVLRNDRVAANRCSSGQFRKLAQLCAERINRYSALNTRCKRLPASVVVSDYLIQLAQGIDFATYVSRSRARQVGEERAAAAKIY